MGKGLNLLSNLEMGQTRQKNGGQATPEADKKDGERDLFLVACGIFQVSG